MTSRKMQLIYLFFYTCILNLGLMPLIGVTPPASFAPFLVVCFYRSTPIGALWWALACGFIVDLFSADAPLGTFAVNYCLVSFFLYSYQFHFFEDRISTLPVLSFVFSFFSNLIKVLSIYLLGKPFSFSWGWVGNEFFICPLQAAFYALLGFTMPLIFIFSLKRRLLIARKRRRELT